MRAAVFVLVSGFESVFEFDAVPNLCVTLPAVVRGARCVVRGAWCVMRGSDLPDFELELTRCRCSSFQTTTISGYPCVGPRSFVQSDSDICAQAL